MLIELKLEWTILNRVLSNWPHAVSTEKCGDLCVEFCSNGSPNLTRVSKQGNRVYSLGKGVCFFKNGVVGYQGPNQTNLTWGSKIPQKPKETGCLSYICPRYARASPSEASLFQWTIATLKQKEHLLIIPTQEGDNNTAALAKKAQQRLYFLRKLRRARAPAPIMCTFYRGTIESILTSCITVWYGACNASCRKSLQRIVRAAEKIVGVSLPSLQDIYSTRLTRKALSIAGDPTHPTHSFFSLLPSGRRLRSLQARTSRLKDSFIHQAVRKLNSLPSLPPLPSFPPRNTELWDYDPPPPPNVHTPRSLPPLQLWPAPVTLCSTGMISTSSSTVCNLPLLTVW